MASPADRTIRTFEDVGLLSPATTDTTGEMLTSDRALVAAMLTAEAALVRALVATRVAPASAASVSDRLLRLDIGARALALDAIEGGNPVIPLVKRLRERVGEGAQWVHYGATSQDILDTALITVSSAVVRTIENDLVGIAHTLAELVEEHRATPAVGRTLSQQAMPTTLGMRLSGWLAGIHDALGAVRGCTTLPVSLGGPVGTAAAYGSDGPAVLEAFARELGQTAPVSAWHTRRTPVLELSSALVGAGAACGKVAADLLVMSQSEIGEAREHFAGTSSSMPHKQNPAQAVLVSSAVRQLAPLAAVIGTSAAAEQERPPGAWHAEWQPLRAMLRLAAGAVERTADLLKTVEFDTVALQRNLDQLLATLGRDRHWAESQTAHVSVWIDRVLAQHADLLN
jgi:3-carboxy-cis,cis-muconate cycloisomerase